MRTNVSVSRISDINNATFNSTLVPSLYERSNFLVTNFLLFFVIASYFCEIISRNYRYYCKDAFKVTQIAEWLRESYVYTPCTCVYAVINSL